MDRRLIRRIVLVAGLMALVLLIGTIGFAIIEGYSLFDAFYMTLITITTVGYQELKPLSQVGRIFNSFLILFGVSIVAFAFGAITQTIIEMELGDRLNKRRTKRMIDSLIGHFIVCGYGRVGKNAALELQRSGAQFLVMDRSEDLVEQAMRAGMLGVLGDGTKDESLRAAGIMRARGLIAALSSDADNLFAILSAKTLNPKLTVVTRADDEDAEGKLRRAGADVVFAPYTMAGLRLARSLLRPHVEQFLDFTTSKTMGLNVAIEQARVEPGTEFVGKTLREMQIRRDLGIIVLAVRKSDGEMIFNPPAETEIVAGDFLIAMGEPPSLQNLESRLTASRRGV